MSEPIPVTEPHRVKAPAPTQRTRIREVLRTPGGMRRAVLLSEILSGPVSMRRSQPQRLRGSR